MNGKINEITGRIREHDFDHAELVTLLAVLSAKIHERRTSLTDRATRWVVDDLDELMDYIDQDKVNQDAELPQGRVQ